MKHMMLVFKKELYRVFSDKKLIFTLFILPALVTFGVYSLLGTLSKSMNKDIEEHTPLTVIVNAASGFREAVAASGFEEKASITWLSEQEFAAQKNELTESLREGEIDLILRFDSDFLDLFQAYQGEGDPIPDIELMYNSTENYSTQAKMLISVVLELYRTTLLQARLGSLDQLTVFNEKDTEIVKSSKADTRFLAMMFPYMIMIMLFSGAMSISIDVFAGEKERGTMAAMLIAPVRRSEIAAGKVAALSVLTAISAVIYAVSMILAIRFMGEGLMPTAGNKISFTLPQILQLGLMLIVLDYFFVAAIAVLSSIAKDMKSAAAYVTPINLAVMACGMMTMFSGSSKTAVSSYAIPLYGNALALQDLISGELPVEGFLLSLGVIALLGMFLTFLLSKVFESDKLMFNA